MNSFQTLFHQYNDIWLDCYVGYFFTVNPANTASKSGIDTFFANNRTFEIYQSFDVTLASGDRIVKTADEFLNCMDTNKLRQIQAEEGVSIIVTMINEAIKYASHQKLPVGVESNLANGFFAVFQNPLIFTNIYVSKSGKSWNPVTAHTMDMMVCCIDNRQIGFMLCVEDN